MHREGQEWKTVRETAVGLKIPLTRCYELIHAGELPAVRVGARSIRVPAQELERILLEQRSISQRRLPEEGALPREDVNREADLGQDSAADTSVSKRRPPSSK